MVGDERDVDPRVRGDVAHPDAVEALLGEALAGRREDRVTGPARSWAAPSLDFSHG